LSGSPSEMPWAPRMEIIFIALLATIVIGAYEIIKHLR
jgi:hypothetical protein